MMSNNKTYNALIIDDEASNRIVLRTLIEAEHKEINILEDLSDIDDAYQKIIANEIDLIFLDIKMPKGGGFKLLEKFTDYKFEIIFVTSYNEYALKAIKASALDYLLKPIERIDLKNAIDKFKKRSIEKLGSNNELIKNLIIEKEKKVAIHHKGNVILTPISEINYIEADVNYTNVYSQTENYYIAKTLAEWEEILSNNSSFVRINKSVIINVDYCSFYEKGNPIIVSLKNNKKIPVSRRRRTEVIEKLKK